jgi:transposase
MDAMHERVAGLDVHKETIVSCARIMPVASGERVYCVPMWRWNDRGLLEVGVEYAERRHVRTDAGQWPMRRPSSTFPAARRDMNDAMWIADLLSWGLIKARGFLEQEIQQLGSLLRARGQLTREHPALRNNV